MQKQLFATFGLAALVALTLASPAHAADSATGAAQATFGTCAEGTDQVALSGTNTGGIWTFTYVLASACDGYNNNGSATGAWDPATGGCAGAICLTNPVPLAGGAVQYSYSNTLEAHSGTATLVIA